MGAGLFGNADSAIFATSLPPETLQTQCVEIWTVADICATRFAFPCVARYAALCPLHGGCVRHAGKQCARRQVGVTTLFVLHSVCVSCAVARSADWSQVHAACLDPNVAAVGCLSTTPMVRTHAACGACLFFPVFDPASSVRRSVAAASVHVPRVRARR